MFISKLELNPRCSQVRAELDDAYQMHRTLSKAFGDDKEAWEKARVLFRVDETNGGHELCALVQSKACPDWTKLTVPENYLIDKTQCKEVAPVVKADQLLVYRLRANPTVKRDGKRFGLYKEEEQYEWLRRKGERGGFALVSVAGRSEGDRKSLTSSGSNTVLLAVVFDGVLRVTDPNAFRDSLESGIGSAKGFGFGMLSIAPYRR